MEKQDINLLNGVSGAAIAIKVIPECQGSKIVRVESDGMIVICLDTIDSDQGINHVLTNFLANQFQIPRSDIEILAGWTKKEKLISIINTNADEIQELLAPFIR